MQQLQYTHAAKKLPVSLLFLCSRTRCRLPFLLAKKFRAPIRTQPCWNPHGTQRCHVDYLKTFLIGDLSSPHFFNRQRFSRLLVNHTNSRLLRDLLTVVAHDAAVLESRLVRTDAAMIASAFLLLPFGTSTLRFRRQNRTA